MNATRDARQRTLDILSRLVAFDTRNPPRALRQSSDVFTYLTHQLSGFDVTLTDHGHGSVTLLALRGRPNRVFNFHLDTVPLAEGWNTNPFELVVGEHRATGLGACDIKGALAVMLCACQSTANDVAILVTSDEEAGNSTCVRRFVESTHGFGTVVVAEPTMCKAVTSHRGILSGRLTFHGVAGHASSARALKHSAVHRAMRWGAKALDTIEQSADDDSHALHDVRLNIGRFEGGVKPNMIAASATAAFNLRTPPGRNQQVIVDALVNLATDDHVSGIEIPFQAPSLPASAHGSDALQTAGALADALGLETSDPVDFWTEAALFSEAGLNSLVLGSGDIAQAHTADEWVALEQLDQLHDIYVGLLSNGIK